MNQLKWRQAAGLGTVLSISFVVYYLTLAPTITWAHDGADGGDLITAAYTLGIPHPPGYPTYVLLGKLFTFLPVSDVAYRVNLMSAFCAAATVALTYLTLMLVLPPNISTVVKTFVAATAALLLAFSHTFWSQAIIAEVYALNAFFVAVMVCLMTLWLRRSEDATGRGDRLLWAVSSVMGVSLGNHLSAVLLLPGVLFLVIKRGRLSVTSWLAMAGFLLLGLSVYLYLPLRAAARPPVNWGNPRTWSGFWWVVSAAPYREYVLALPLAYLPGRLSSWVNMLAQQFAWPGLALGLAGIWHLWDQERDYALFSLTSFVAVVIYSLNYNTPDSYVYLIPSYLLFAVWIGWGAHFLIQDVIHPWLLAKRRAPWSGDRPLQLIGLAILVLPAFLIFSNYAALDLSRDRTAYDYASDVFERVPPDALIIADTTPHIFALWYFRYVVVPEPAPTVLAKGLLQFEWYREAMAHQDSRLIMPSDRGDFYAELLEMIDSNVAQRTVYLTDLDDEITARYPYTEVGSLYRLD